MVEKDLDLPDLLDGWIVPPKMQADGGILVDDYTIPDYYVFDIRSVDEFNEWTRLQINYLYIVEESSDTGPSLYNEIDNNMLMVQLQVVF